MLRVDVLGIGGGLLRTRHTTTDAAVAPTARKPGTGVGLTFRLNLEDLSRRLKLHKPL
jgi:hypothetical protein